MKLGHVHLSKEEAAVTIGGFTQVPPADVLAYVVIVATPARPIMSTSAESPQDLLMLLSSAQYLAVRGLFFEEPQFPGEPGQEAGGGA